MKYQFHLGCLTLLLLFASTLDAQLVSIQYYDGMTTPRWHTGSHASAGDVNGDGVSDIIIGAPRNPYFATLAFPSGVVQVFSGADGSMIHEILGSITERDFGKAVDGAGDVNNDGFDDFIVGIPRDETFLPLHGSARIYSGLDGTVLYQVLGGNILSEAGFAVAGLGDINGDGHSDFAVGERRAYITGANQGRVRVYSGIDRSLIRIHTSQNTSEIGSSLANAGDVNGDGVNDMIVGMPKYDQVLGTSLPNAGRVTVFSGVDGTEIVSVTGDEFLAELGHAVAGVGDMDGDGFDDFVASEPYKTNIGNSGQGRVRVFSGADASVLHVVRGDASYRVGRSVAGVGDIDGDGVVDFATDFSEATMANPVLPDVVRIFSGANGSVIFEVPSVFGIARESQEVAGLGDLNGDGFPEIAVSSYRAWSGAGEVRVYASGISPVGSYLSNSGNFSALRLSWVPEGGNINTPTGKLVCIGVTPGGLGLILVSLGKADISVLGFDLLCAIDPANLVLTATLGADFGGQFVVDGLSRRNPAIAGTVLNIQFVETSPSIGASNGVSFIAIP